LFILGMAVRWLFKGEQKSSWSRWTESSDSVDVEEYLTFFGDDRGAHRDCGQSSPSFLQRFFRTAAIHYMKWNVITTRALESGRYQNIMWMNESRRCERTGYFGQDACINSKYPLHMMSHWSFFQGFYELCRSWNINNCTSTNSKWGADKIKSKRSSHHKGIKTNRRHKNRLVLLPSWKCCPRLFQAF